MPVGATLFRRQNLRVYKYKGIQAKIEYDRFGANFQTHFLKYTHSWVDEGFPDREIFSEGSTMSGILPKIFFRSVQSIVLEIFDFKIKKIPKKCLF